MSVGPTAARSWFLERSGGGGNLLERGSHQLDLQRAVAGEVESVQVAATGIHLAQSEIDPGDIEDAATMTLRFANGAVGTVILAWTTQGQPGAYTLDVLAPSATLHIKLDPAFTLTGQVGDTRIKETMVVHPFERAIARFVDAVEAGEPRTRVFCTPRDAIGTLATALACERSLLEGGRSVEVAEVLGSVTMRREGAVEEYVVPAALALPSNRAYLAHLAASAGNPNLIRLASNENTEPPSPRVREALERAYDDANLSPPPSPPLQSALAGRYGVEPSQVLVTAGSTEVIDAVFRTFLRAGSEVVIPDPSWPVFRRRLDALEAQVVDVPLSADEHGFHYDVNRILDAIGSATRLVVVCTPNNPTGNAMELADIERIAETGRAVPARCRVRRLRPGP